MPTVSSDAAVRIAYQILSSNDQILLSLNNTQVRVIAW
jgi:hypothetical protein